MKFTIFQESRLGARRNNEDRTAYSYSRETLLMLVADGMGGHRHGEVAAQLAVRSIAREFERAARPRLEEPEDFLIDAVRGAHHAILDFALDRGLGETPRTTIVACVVQEGHAWWTHAGDSRLYAVHGKHLTARTRDHSGVQLLIDQGLIGPAEAATHPDRNRVYSCLGGDQAPRLEVSAPLRLRNGDTVLLCSDGLWGPLDDREIVAGMAHVDLMRAVPRLLSTAEQRAGKNCDNLSAVAMRWHDETSIVSTDTISTADMGGEHFTTRLEQFNEGAHAEPGPDLSDDEIERAIDEINRAIGRLD